MSNWFWHKGLRLMRPIVPFTVLSLTAPAAIGADQPEPSLQDLQVVARVLSFQTRPATGTVTLAIVANPADAASVSEARSLSALLAGGLAAGGITLQARTVSQADVADLDHVDAVFSTRGIDDRILRPALLRLHVPCLTLSRPQVERGACMVAIRSTPTISIVLNQADADAAGVHFATAFRMMVQEL